MLDEKPPALDCLCNILPTRIGESLSSHQRVCILMKILFMPVWSMAVCGSEEALSADIFVGQLSTRMDALPECCMLHCTPHNTPWRMEGIALSNVVSISAVGGSAAIFEG